MLNAMTKFDLEFFNKFFQAFMFRHHHHHACYILKGNAQYKFIVHAIYIELQEAFLQTQLFH